MIIYWKREEFTNFGISCNIILVKTLIIKSFDVDEPEAKVKSHLDGTFEILADDSEAKNYFQQLVDKISRENPVLPLGAGKTETQGKVLNNTDLVKNVDVKDPDYLSALGDYLTVAKLEYQGKRVRGYTIDDNK